MMRMIPVALLLVVSSAAAQSGADRPVSPAAPLTVGETFTLQSKVLGETRRINVYLPPVYADSAGRRFPVLYMLDGGLGEDFLHVAGLVQVSVGNFTMRPMVLVGIENTDRRRDLTGPTEVASDRAIAPRVGGSAAFRAFVRTELIPEVERRYRTTAERAIIGESLAGLFVVETFFLESTLFDTYVAFDPSLWWNAEALVKGAAERFRSGVGRGRTLHVATSGHPIMTRVGAEFERVLQCEAPAGLRWSYEPMPNETHATIFHPAALWAVRRLFRPDSSAR